jgi:hypothetical protein
MRRLPFAEEAEPDEERALRCFVGVTASKKFVVCAGKDVGALGLVPEHVRARRQAIQILGPEHDFLVCR